MPTPSSTGLSTMPTASSCGATRCAAANRICLGMKRINQINNLQHLSTLLTHSQPATTITKNYNNDKSTYFGRPEQDRMYHAAAVRQSRDQNPSATGCRFGPKRPVGFHRNRLPV